MKIAEKIMELSPNIALVIWVLIIVGVIAIAKNWKKIKAFGDGIIRAKIKNDEYKKMLINADKKVGEHEKTIHEQDQLIKSFESKIKELQEKIDEYEKANEEHWGVSVEYRDKYDEQQCRTVESFDRLTDAINALGEKIDQNQKKTDERFKESEERNNKRVRAELKNEISEIYRRHHRTGKISSMALEVLENLIEEYESADGDNSFVHSVVQKEMYSWECLDDID